MLPTFFALLVGVVLEFYDFVEVVGAALFFDVLLNELRKP